MTPLLSVRFRRQGTKEGDPEMLVVVAVVVNDVSL
jgi:hypothetical protein